MKTAIYYQGYNRAENYQIIYLERSKLNGLLDEERRLIETLASRIKRQIETVANSLIADVRSVWRNIENHTLVKQVREKISRLTDAYPQFIAQVKTAREKVKKRILNQLEIVKELTQTAARRH